MPPLITSWLFDSIMYFIQISIAAACLFGLLLVITPKLAISLQQHLNLRFSGRRLSRPLEVPISIERHVYRHARLAGIILMVGAIGMLLLNWQLPAYVQVNSPSIWTWLADALYWFLWISGISTFFIGLTCFVRPSLLKPLESKANQWISSRQKTRRLSQEFTPLDSLLEQHPRLVGGVITAVSTLLLIMLIKA